MYVRQVGDACAGDKVHEWPVHRFSMIADRENYEITVYIDAGAGKRRDWHIILQELSGESAAMPTAE